VGELPSSLRNLGLKQGLLQQGENAGAQTITDGDTIKLNGTTYRLWDSIDPRLTHFFAAFTGSLTASKVANSTL
jgi:hypothetical protein